MPGRRGIWAPHRRRRFDREDAKAEPVAKGGGERATFTTVNMWVRRSVRAGGDIKTRKSRCALILPQRCVDVLRDHQARRQEIRIRLTAGSRWQDNDLVFPSRVGTPADASHLRRSFRKVVAGNRQDLEVRVPLRNSS
jgi:hypothetical protein